MTCVEVKSKCMYTTVISQTLEWTNLPPLDFVPGDGNADLVKTGPVGNVDLFGTESWEEKIQKLHIPQHPVVKPTKVIRHINNRRATARSEVKTLGNIVLVFLRRRDRPVLLRGCWVSLLRGRGIILRAWLLPQLDPTKPDQLHIPQHPFVKPTKVIRHINNRRATW
jgi:hypothetical protein